MGGAVPPNPSWMQASPLLPHFSKRSIRPARGPERPLLVGPGRKWQTAARRALLSAGGVREAGLWLRAPEVGLCPARPAPGGAPLLPVFGRPSRPPPGACGATSQPAIAWPGPVRKEQLRPRCCQDRRGGRQGGCRPGPGGLLLAGEQQCLPRGATRGVTVPWGFLQTRRSFQNLPAQQAPKRTRGDPLTSARSSGPGVADPCGAQNGPGTWTAQPSSDSDVRSGATSSAWSLAFPRDCQAGGDSATALRAVPAGPGAARRGASPTQSRGRQEQETVSQGPPRPREAALHPRGAGRGLGAGSRVPSAVA